jgi:hypothetical protein
MKLAVYTPDENFKNIPRHIAIVDNTEKLVIATFGATNDDTAARDAARFLACYEAMRSIPTNKIDEAGKMARQLFGLRIQV